MSMHKSRPMFIIPTIFLLLTFLLAFPVYADNPEINETSHHKLAGPPTLEQLRATLSETVPVGDQNSLSPNYKKKPLPNRYSQGSRNPDQEFGTNIYEVSGSPTNPGVYAVHKVNLTMDTPEDPDEDTEEPLYAPTIMPPNNSRFEATIIYWQPYEYGSTLREFGIYDHSVGDWWQYSTWSLSTLSDYISSGYCEVCVQYLDSEWRVWLYDYEGEEWDQFAHASGSSGHDDGWDMWEAIHDNYVSSYDSIEAYDIRVWKNNTWHDVTNPDYGEERDENMNASWDTTWPSSQYYYHWEVEP